MNNNNEQRYFLELAYNGTRYHGWQVQANSITVQEVLEGALGKILRRPTPVMGSGRTDTGVHAKQQFAHFDSPPIPDLELFKKSMNAVLPPDVAVYSVFPVRKNAHTRFDAVWRSYEYHITYDKSPFEHDLVWRCYYDLDIDAMNNAASILLEHEDFESFSRVKTEATHFRCKIKEAYWEQKEQHLIFHITANRFLRGMVRAIVGTLVLVGRGKLSMEGFTDIINSKKRVKAGAAAPAQGLFLCRVVYPGTIFV